MHLIKEKAAYTKNVCICVHDYVHIICVYVYTYIRTCTYVCTVCATTWYTYVRTYARTYMQKVCTLVYVGHNLLPPYQLHTVLVCT